MEETYSIACLKRGDMKGLDWLMQHYQLRALRAAYLIVRDQDAAEDIVQDAFVRLVSKIDQYDTQRPFGPWFFRSVINDALMFLRKQQRQVSLEADDDESAPELLECLRDPSPDPETLVADEETRRAVWRAMGQLSPEQCAVIVQRYYLGMSEAEMSQEMKRPAGTVKWLAHEARKRLARLLRPELRPAADSHHVVDEGK
ncbi:MAG: RNA polymerase sigma factor [Anaerolineaceae bacterium]|nr:RNA polymerase sigma factor [Anaerolineaceae bacterium]